MTARSARIVFDGVGVAILFLTIVVAIVAASVWGGDPGPVVALLLAAAGVVTVGRLIGWIHRALVPLTIAFVAMVLALTSGVLDAGPLGGPFDYRNATGAFYVQATIASLMVVAAVRWWPLRLVGSAVAASFAAVAANVSLAAAAGLLVVAVTLIALGGARLARWSIVVVALIFVAILAGTVALSVGQRPGADTLLVRALTERRLELWHESLAIIADHPGGVGPGRFEDVDPTALRDRDARWAHNEFLQQGVELGWAGIVLVVLLFLWGFVLLWVHPAPDLLVALGAASLAALGIHASVDYILHFPAVPLAAAALVGTAQVAPLGDRHMTMMTLARKVSKATLTPLGWPTRRRRGDVVVLLYHRVGSGGSEIELPVEAFERQLEDLVAEEHLLTLDEVLADDPDGGVLVTFDDGYRDFHQTVLPLLADYRVPVVLYLATGLVANDARPSSDALTWTQLREVRDSGLVTTDLHTHGHTDLSRATEVEAESEMLRSKELVEDQLGTACEHFAYPWAVGGEAADRVGRRLFRTVAVDAWRTNRAGQIDPYRLGRVPIMRSDGRFFFRRKVRGELDSEAWLYRALGRGPWGPAARRDPKVQEKEE